MDNLMSGFDLASVLDELNKSNEGKDVAGVSADMSEEMEASAKRVEEYILKNATEQ